MLDPKNKSFVQDLIEQQIDAEELEPEEQLDFNLLQMYFGEDYKVNDRITIHQPSIQDFIDNGDENMYSVIIPFVSNTTGYRVKLWEKGLDWNKISNQTLFAMLIKNIDHQYSKILFGDIDFSSFILKEKRVGDEQSIVLYSPKMDLEIDEDTRNKMCKYIQYLFNSFPPEEEFTSNRILKQELINNDKQKQIAKAKENRGTNQSLLGMISFYLTHPGCKYKKEELRNVGFFEFMYNIQRLQIYESTHALYGGMYSGFMDTSKIKQSEFDFMRDIKVTS